MACMLKNEQHLGPRISFSNDFADPQPPMKLENSYREAPVSSDFEFSAPNFNINISADELFSQGRMVPLRENCTTLRDELLLADDYQGLSAAKGCRRWRERLGLKRSASSHAAVPKIKSGKSLGSIDELKIQDIIHGGDINDCFVFKG